VIDNLSGTQLTDALRAYVNRINLNPDDAPLQIGTGKELDEAVARQVLDERTGDYAIGGHSGSFPVTLAVAFTALQLALSLSRFTWIATHTKRFSSVCCSSRSP
jgi:hypothetical protein